VNRRRRNRLHEPAGRSLGLPKALESSCCRPARRRRDWSQDHEEDQFSLQVAPLLLEEARKLAQAEGVGLNQLINVAVAEKLAALRTESYFAERARRASLPKALKILKRAGAGKPPMKDDEMGGRRKRR
jgi:hypothetical protein